MEQLPNGALGPGRIDPMPDSAHRHRLGDVSHKAGPGAGERREDIDQILGFDLLGQARGRQKRLDPGALGGGDLSDVAYQGV